MKLKKILAIVLAFAMVLSTMSFSVFAEGASTLPEAVDGVITLTEDVTLSETYKIEEGTTLTINLNGCTIDVGYQAGSSEKHIYAIDNYGTLTLTGNGTINSRGIGNHGTLTIEDGTYNAIDDNGGSAVWNYSGSELTINDGTFTAADASTAPAASVLYLDEGATADINGGTFTSNADWTYAIISNGDITIDDATVNSEHGAIAAENGSVTISSGSYNISGSGHVVYIEEASVTIKDGTFSHNQENASSEGNAIIYAGTNPVIVEGGNFNSVNAAFAYASANIILEGGSFTAAASKVYQGENGDNVGSFAEVGTVITIDGTNFIKKDDGSIIEPETIVATVGDEEFTDLQEAIKFAAPAGTVEIIDNIVVDEWIMFSQRLSIGSGQIISLDMNGLTIKGNGKTLTVNSIESATNGNRLFHEADNLNIENLTINYADGVVGGISLKSGELKDVTINGGVGVFPGNGDITITGCEFNTNGSAIYNEEARDNLVVTGNTFNTTPGQYSIYLRGNTTFTNNTVVNGKVNVVSGSPVVTGNDFGNERFKVYNASTASIEDNKIIVLEFNDASEVKSSFSDNTLSEDAKSALKGVGVAVKTTPVAALDGVNYPDFQSAYEAAEAGDTITMVSDIIITKPIDIKKNITLDLNGKTIEGIDKATGSFGLITVHAGVELTIKDTVGTGKVTLTATNNREWNAYSSVVSNQRGKLTVNGGTIEHLGGTDMAYGIDNLTNGKGTYAETIINGGTIKSTYRGIRQFLNGTEAQNILTINGGTVEGANKSVWMQDPSKNANTGKLTITDGATLNGDVYLFVTEGSTAWPVEVSIATSVVNGEIITKNIPDGYELVNKDGEFSVKESVIPEGTVTLCYTSAEKFWGEAGANSENSFVIELYEEDKKIASASLNDIDNIIDGELYVTWNIPFAPNTDPYWNVEWAEGYPKYDMNPTAVKLFSDGVEVAENVIKYNAPDNLKKIVALGEDAEGNVKAYATLEEAVAAATKVSVVNDTTLSEDLTLPAGITFNGNGKNITGNLVASGDVTFTGHTKVTNFNAGYNKPVITIGEGACLELTGTGRMVIGHGATFNITGTIEDAKATTNARAIVEPSLIMPGASFTGAGVNFNVKNAYIKALSNCTSKNSNASGTHNFNLTNSIWEQTGTLAFYVPTNGMDPTFNLNVKDSVINSTSHLVFAVTKGEIVIDNSIINDQVKNDGTRVYKQLENRSNMTIKNGSVVYASVATSENAKNPGTLTVDNATFISEGTFGGSDLGQGTLILKNGASFTTDTLENVNATVDATSTLTATIGSGATVTEKGSTLAGAGTEADPYIIADLYDLEFFRDSVNAGNNYAGKYVKLTADIDLAQEEWVPIGNSSKMFSGYFDGNNKTISNLTVSGNNKYAGFFGYIKGTGMTERAIPTVQNLTLDNVSVSGDYYVGGLSGQGYTCKVANVTVKGNVTGSRYVGGLIGHVYTYIDNCHFIGNVTGSFDAIGGIAGAGDGRIYNSSVIGDVTGSNWVGGIIANGQEGTSVVGCYVKGTVSTSNNYYFGIGGIAGVGGHGYNGSVIKDNYFDGEVYLCGEKVNAIVVGFINADSNDTIGTTVDGNSWNTEYYSAETPVVVTSEVSKNISAEDWAASASEEKSSVRNNNLVMLESDLQYVDAQDINDVTKMIFSSVDDAAIQAVVEFNAPIEVSNKEELDAAIAAAKEGQTILLTADIDYSNALKIEKAITLDLGGKTLTTRWAYGGMFLKNNPSIKNGTIVHASNTAAIKAWNVDTIENVVIDVQGKGDANKVIGGIVVQNEPTARINTIKNVTIKGVALTNGIETYNCGDATENVIGSMENVTIDAVGTGMLISAPCGTATNCNIKGGTNGIEIWIKGTYSASLNLVDCAVDGGVYAHDEFNSNPNTQNNGTLELTVDEGTTGAGEEDITLTIARAENIEGVLETVLDNSKAKIGDTYYQTFQKAIDNAKDGSTITLLENMTLVDTTYTIADGMALTLDLNGKKITATENKTSNYELFYNFGELTVVGNGSIELTATKDRDWNALSAIFHNRGGVLTIENGTFTHNGGTDMAYVVDNSGNSYGDATTVVNNGSLKSSYIAIRNRMDTYGANGGGNGIANLDINGGTFEGKYAIWGQVSSANVKGNIDISNGTFIAAEGKAAILVDEDTANEINTAISGGIFSSDVSAFLVDGTSISKNIDGTYGVVAERTIEVSVEEDKEVEAGEEFTVTVKLAKGENIVNAVWTLSYETDKFELKDSADQSGTIKEGLWKTHTSKDEIFAEGEVLKTYTFVAKAVPAKTTGAFELSETTASTITESNNAVEVAATNNEKVDVTIIMKEYDVTATLNGAPVDLTVPAPVAETTYTGKAQKFVVETNLPAEEVDYDITYTVNNDAVEEVSLTNAGTYEVVYTITTENGYANKTGKVTITVKDPEFVVETTKWTNMGKKLVLVYTNQDDLYFTYNGNLMINVDAKGYKYENTTEYEHVFAFVTDELANDVVDNYKANIKYISEDEGLFILTAGYSKADINFSKSLNVQDITVEYGIVNLHSEIYGDVKYQKHLLKGDTNGDKIVNGADTGYVVSEVKTAMGLR